MKKGQPYGYPYLVFRSSSRLVLVGLGKAGYTNKPRLNGFTVLIATTSKAI